MENIPQDTEQTFDTSSEFNTDINSSESESSFSEDMSETIPETHESETTNETHEPEYIQRRLGRQQRKHEQEKAEIARQYEKQIQELQSQRQYADEKSMSAEDIDLTNPQHLIAAMQEVARQELIEQQNQAREYEKQNQLNQSIQKSVIMARKKYPDLDKLTSEYEGTTPPPGFIESLARCKNSPDVLYQLFKNPVEYERLLSMDNPYDVLSRVTEISVRLALKSKANAVSKVGEPIQTLGTSGLGGNSKKSYTDARKELREHSKRRRTR